MTAWLPIIDREPITTRSNLLATGRVVVPFEIGAADYRPVEEHRIRADLDTRVDVTPLPTYVLSPSDDWSATADPFGRCTKLTARSPAMVSITLHLGCRSVRPVQLRRRGAPSLRAR